MNAVIMTLCCQETCVDALDMPRLLRLQMMLQFFRTPGWLTEDRRKLKSLDMSFDEAFPTSGDALAQRSFCQNQRRN